MQLIYLQWLHKNNDDHSPKRASEQLAKQHLSSVSSMGLTSIDPDSTTGTIKAPENYSASISY